MTVLDTFQERLAQYNDRDFLKAAMAACALAAYADGKVSLSERYSIDDMLENLQRLTLHNAEKAAQILDDFLHELRENPEGAEAVLIGKLKRIANDKTAAELVAAIALSVCQADGDFVYLERMQFQAICDNLGVDADSISPVVY